MIWAAAGDKTPLKEVQVIPAWFMLGLASAVEWVYFILTLGKKRPKMLRRFYIEHTCLQRTFSIEKARKVLGYTPLDDRDGMIRALSSGNSRRRSKRGNRKLLEIPLGAAGFWDDMTSQGQRIEYMNSQETSHNTRPNVRLNILVARSRPSILL